VLWALEFATAVTLSQFADAWAIGPMPTCPMSPVRQALQQSEAVLLARVLSERDLPRLGENGSSEKVIDVLMVWKGNLGPREVIVADYGNDLYNMDVGEEYVIYADVWHPTIVDHLGPSTWPMLVEALGEPGGPQRIVQVFSGPYAQGCAVPLAAGGAGQLATLGAGWAPKRSSLAGSIIPVLMAVSISLFFWRLMRRKRSIAP
jgi:hypothetical protein